MELIWDMLLVFWKVGTSPVVVFLLGIVFLVICGIIIADCLDRGREVR